MTYSPAQYVAALIEAQRDIRDGLRDSVQSANRPRFACMDCHASTTEPSFTDPSEVVDDPETGPRLSGVHYACCPQCGSTRLRRVQS